MSHWSLKLGLTLASMWNLISVIVGLAFILKVASFGGYLLAIFGAIMICSVSLATIQIWNDLSGSVKIKVFRLFWIAAVVYNFVAAIYGNAYLAHLPSKDISWETLTFLQWITLILVTTLVNSSTILLSMIHNEDV